MFIMWWFCMLLYCIVGRWELGPFFYFFFFFFFLFFFLIRCYKFVSLNFLVLFTALSFHIFLFCTHPIQFLTFITLRLFIVPSFHLIYISSLPLFHLVIQFRCPHGFPSIARRTKITFSNNTSSSPISIMKLVST